MNQRASFLGALTYEFRMQLHRRAVWITFIALGLFFTQFHQPWFRPITTPVSASIIYWTGIVQSFLAVAAGLLLADRLPRDRRMKVDELLNTLPCTVSARVFGKYLGSTIATLVPMFVIYSIGTAYILVRWHTLQELPLALASFIAIVLPGVMLIGAFSISCTYDRLHLNPESHLVTLDGVPLDLSPIEFALLHLFIRSPGRAFSRAYLLDTIWGETYVGGDRSVDNTILRLRKKLGTMGEAIKTVWGIGYKLRPEERH